VHICFKRTQLFGLDLAPSFFSSYPPLSHCRPEYLVWLFDSMSLSLGWWRCPTGTQSDLRPIITERSQDLTYEYNTFTWLFHNFWDFIFFQDFSRSGNNHFKIPWLYKVFHDRTNPVLNEGLNITFVNPINLKNIQQINRLSKKSLVAALIRFT